MERGEGKAVKEKNTGMWGKGRKEYKGKGEGWKRKIGGSSSKGAIWKKREEREDWKIKEGKQGCHKENY